ncbi:MAG TPA: response regulator transcription factor [Terriglobia bacterium]|nr:response regulator transcription factor [Terriglobia bacterium]
MIKVCIIEDHAIVRAGLRMLIENSPRMSVLWETQTATEALSNPGLELPQVILLDLDLGIERGLDLLPSLLEKFSPVRILILTALADTQQHLAAVASGASGVVLKEQAPETLIQAIESVYSGEAWLGKSLMSAVMGKLSRTSSDKPDPEAEKIARLTPREVEIVGLVSEGLNGERIAKQLRISEATVRNHLTSILGKLGLSNKFELAVYAHRHRIGGKPG